MLRLTIWGAIAVCGLAGRVWAADEWKFRSVATPRFCLVAGVSLAGSGDLDLGYTTDKPVYETRVVNTEQDGKTVEKRVTSTVMVKEHRVQSLPLARVRIATVAGKPITAPADIERLKGTIVLVVDDADGLPPEFAKLLAGDAVVVTVARADQTGSSTFTASKLKELRQKAGQARHVDGKGPDGWSKSAVDLTKLVQVFTPLKLKAGVVLRAYQFRAGGNGNGVVWALPAGAEFPAPDACPKVKREPLVTPVPRPSAALPSVMGQVQGDGSAWSYMAASLLGREIQEFGAMWHGTKWGTHFIVDQNPLTNKTRASDPMSGPVNVDPKKWQWAEPEPKDWRPTVTMSGNRVTVRFYTYSGLHRQRIVRHVDTYTPGNYQYTTEEKDIATGPGGFMF